MLINLLLVMPSDRVWKKSTNYEIFFVEKGGKMNQLCGKQCFCHRFRRETTLK